MAVGGILLLALISPTIGAKAAGASLSFSPPQGSYFTDSTFDVSVVVNTGSQAINAIEAFISFPVDKLQVVSPTVSNSFIQIWTAGPSYSNTSGTITFQGGLPQPGITTTAGIISTVRFRAKAAGTAILKFSDNSRVLANDGSGTNILTSKSNSTIEIKLAPPLGPVVSSSTNQDQNSWYKSRNVAISWEPPTGATSYAYVFDNSPTTTPPDQDTTTETKLFKTLNTDGLWYFHIKAKNGSTWGGTTNFIVRVDTTPPASFKPSLSESSISVNTRGIVSFNTTDAASGLGHYEVKIVHQDQNADTVTLFTEQSSPYQLPDLPVGNYIVVVRAFDQAGNYTDEQVPFSVSTHALPLLGLSPLLGNNLLTNILLILLTLILVILGLILYRNHRRNSAVEKLHSDLKQAQEVLAKRQTELQRLTITEAEDARAISQLQSPDSPVK